jgi:hypothetical protein
MKIDQAAYDKLTSEQKRLWKKVGEEYELVGDTEIAAEMRRAKERETLRASAAEAQLEELRTKVTELEGNNGRKAGDIAAIERSWNDKLTAANTNATKKETALKAQLEKLMIDGAVNAMAAEIFVKPGRDSRLLRDRVYVEYEGETPVLKIKGADGKPSALTLDDLKKETVDNTEFADILIGSKASGSGGAGGTNSGGAGKKPSDYTEAERVALYRDNPTKFRELFPTPAT